MGLLLSIRNQLPTKLSNLPRHRQYPAAKFTAQTNLEPLFEPVSFSAGLKKLYRKEILKEQEEPGFISLGEIKPAAPVVKAEEETVAGD